MGLLFDSFETPTPSRKDMQRIGIDKTNTEQRKVFAQTVQQAPKGKLALAFEQDDSLRPDGTKKGKGFLGEQKLPGGGVATEYSVGVQLESRGGKETDIPSLVPTLTPEERALMINDIIPNKKQIPESIIQKAVDHANMRVKTGKSIFAEDEKPRRRIESPGIDIYGQQDLPTMKVKKPERSRYLDFIDRAASGMAGIASAGATALAGMMDISNQIPSPYMRPQAKVDEDVAKLKKSAEFLWDIRKDPFLEAQNTDNLSKVFNLAAETVPYITATSVATVVAGPFGGFAVGSMVEGNSAYRTALDHFTELNKGKPLTDAQKSQAKMIGAMVGVAAGAIEAYGGKYAGELFEKVAGKIANKAGQTAAKFGISTVIEALEEGSQEIAAIAGESTYRDVSWEEGVKRTLGSMAAGGLLGGTAKVGSSSFSGFQNIKGTQELEQVAKKLGVPIKGLTNEAAVKKIDKVMANRRALEPTEETGPETDVAQPEPPLLGAEGITVAPDAATEQQKTDEALITPETQEVAPEAKQPWEMTREEYTSQRKDKTKQLENDVFYINGVEVIQNPTSSDMRQLNKEVKERFPGIKDATTRFTEDDYGNKFVWAADKAIHSQIDPEIAKKIGREVNQNADFTFSKTNHKRIIYNAVKEGKAVPREVLEEYKSEKWAQEALAKPTPAKAEGKGEVKKVTITDKSVRDHPQQVVVSGDSIEVRSKVGKKLAGKYTIPLDEWNETQKHPNPAWAQFKLIQKYTAELDEQPGGPDQAQRIRDSQARAINKALSPPIPKKGTVARKKMDADALETPIGKEERETLRAMGLSIEEIGKTPVKDLREKINTRSRRQAGGFLNIPFETPEPGKIRTGLESWYQNYVNRFASIENIVAKARKLGMVVKPGEDAGVRAREYLGMGRKIESVLRDKTFRITPSGKILITGEGLKPILDSYDRNMKGLIEPNRKQREQDFEDYLIAQRTIEDLQRPAYEGTERLIASPEEIAAAREKVLQILDKYGVEGTAEIERHAQRLYAYQKRILHSLVDAGNLSQEMFDTITRANPHYIPFDRVLTEDTLTGVPVSKKRFTGAKAPVRKIKGSKGLKVHPVIESVIKNTYKILEAAERNQVARSVAKLGKVLPGDINPIRIKMFPIKVDPREILTIEREFRSRSAKVVQEVKKIRTEGGENADVSGPIKKLETVVKDALTSRGFSEGEANSFVAQIKKGKPAEGDAGSTHTIETIKQVINETQQIIRSKEPVESTIFRPSQFAPKGNVIEYYENGKRKYMEVPKNVYKAMTGLTEEGASMVAKILAVPAHWLRVGATITPEFMLRNPLRDTWTAVMQTSFGFVPFYDQTLAIADILGKKDVYYDWFRSGGAYSGFVELNRPSLQKAYKELMTTRGRKVLKGLNIIADAQNLSQLLEESTRLAIYKRAIRKGLSPVEAGYASRESTVDFARRGAKMGDFSKMTAFLNASIQGFDKTIRNSIQHPYATAIKGVMTITLPSLLLYLRNRDDEEYKEIAPWRRDLFWNFKIGENWWAAPKPFIYGQVFGTITERFLEYLDSTERGNLALNRISGQNVEIGKSPELDRLAVSILESSLPLGLDPIGGLLPTGAKPLVENMFNYNIFREQNIVPQHLVDMPGADQFSRYTTETAKQLGEWTGYSPAKIENLIYGYTGGTGRHILQGTDALVNAIKGEKIQKRPTELADIPLVKGFVTRPPMGPSAESISTFYEDSKPIIALKSSYNSKLRKGDEEGAIKLFEKNPKIRLAPTLVKFQTALSELSKVADNISSSDIPTEQKRAQLKIIDKRRIDLAREANQLMQQD